VKARDYNHDLFLIEILKDNIREYNSVYTHLSHEINLRREML